ncbi:MAG: response regulator [Candidatus Omnitrophota bacterium]|nr:response regulator [Candidatus Omnitrophota bacterium]
MLKKRILLVEDEQDIVTTLVFRLEAEGYEIITAMDGEDGLNQARTEKPDLILLDLMLPKMDGYKVCIQLKGDSRFSHIPIIIFTARAEEADRKKSEIVGADAYITKPFEPPLLLAKIKELLNIK